MRVTESVLNHEILPSFITIDIQNHKLIDIAAYKKKYNDEVFTIH